MKKFYFIISFLIIVSMLPGCTKSSNQDPEPVTETTSSAVTTQAEEYSFEKYGIEMFDTDDSTCFSAIGYDSVSHILQVTFRNSGVTYQYSDIGSDVWNSLKSSYAKGKFYNSDIKGRYECKRMD